MGKYWLRGSLCKFIAFNRLNLVSFHPPSLHELHRVACKLRESHFSKLTSKLHEIHPSFHCTKSLKVVADATALASPAPFHRGRTPYDVAKEYGPHQKVMGLLHSVPQRKAMEDWELDEHVEAVKKTYNLRFMTLLANACLIHGRTIRHIENMGKNNQKH